MHRRFLGGRGVAAEADGGGSPGSPCSRRVSIGATEHIQVHLDRFGTQLSAAPRSPQGSASSQSESPTAASPKATSPSAASPKAASPKAASLRASPRANASSPKDWMLTWVQEVVCVCSPDSRGDKCEKKRGRR
mmetsp:Transcript_14482/g.38538  ORF Transcript_14482/g.38538 Transcript_14482/m.38538 type:complete len:134 (-) Transcript_14482:56-457(-)